jgi:tRNA pseudouridine32 synthase / 23S rRNA pseudouridine746 synthase
LPERFTYPFEYNPHSLCLLAAEQLQNHIATQRNWVHNFGLEEGESGLIVGKMFGVLVVKTQEGEVGYLSAFSGKLAGGNHHPKFVPPVFDSLTEGSFLNLGMLELTEMNSEIKSLKANKNTFSNQRIAELKEKRKAHSIALQSRFYDSFSFLNQYGEEKSLRKIFKDNINGNPPGGAGECAVPKLLQYAFLQKMKPLAMAEFWWGVSPTDQRIHGQFYPVCSDKCPAILEHMLKDIVVDEKPE